MPELDILLIEDSHEDALLTMRALRKANPTHEMHWVQDGEEALNFLFKQQQSNAAHGKMPRVIFLDLKMPKMTGLEVLAQLRSQAHTQHLPVVILSSSGEDNDISESYDLGANSFVVKPMDFREFERTIAELGRYWLQLNLTPYGSIAS